MKNFNVALTKISRNSKTGPIPVTTSSAAGCPDSCPLKANGCYAEGGHTRLHWSKVTSGERGVSWAEFLREVKALPKGQLWRHNVAGDLPHNEGEIDQDALSGLVRSNKGKRGFTYTHHELSPHNWSQALSANDAGFTVNISANNVEQAAQYYRTGLPTVTLLPSDAPNVQRHAGVKIVACPAEKSDKVSCATCGLCADSDRSYVIGFRAHGTSKKKADLIAQVA